MTKEFYKEIDNHAEYFIQAAHRVAKWNAVALNSSTTDLEVFSKNFTPEKFESQLRFLESELEEYKEAYAEKDHVEILDALADSFVVSSFLIYMFFGPQTLERFLSLPVGDHFADDPATAFREAIAANATNDHIAYISVAVLRQSRDSLCRSDYNCEAVVEEVLSSNDSKFPTLEQLQTTHGTDLDEKELLAKEMGWLRKNRVQYSNFTYTYNPEYKVYVFFDGQGKIMKPSTFREPVLNLAKLKKK